MTDNFIIVNMNAENNDAVIEFVKSSGLSYTETDTGIEFEFTNAHRQQLALLVSDIVMFTSAIVRSERRKVVVSQIWEVIVDGYDEPSIYTKRNGEWFVSWNGFHSTFSTCMTETELQELAVCGRAKRIQ